MEGRILDSGSADIAGSGVMLAQGGRPREAPIVMNGQAHLVAVLQDAIDGIDARLDAGVSGTERTHLNRERHMKARLIAWFTSRSGYERG